MIKKALMYTSGIIGLKESDVILTSYPRSGNTWVRFFFCNLISLNEWKGETVNFEILNETMPEFGVSNLMKSWPHKTIPRIVKTHKKYWPIFRNKRSILIVRDPRDVMVSYYHYLCGKQQNNFKCTFEEFIKYPKYGLNQCLSHYRSWKQNADLIVHYEDLRRDAFIEFKRMLKILNVLIDEDLIREAVRRSDFKNVRFIENKDRRGGKEEKFKGSHKFTRDGRTKQWKDYFDKNMLNYYNNLKERFNFEDY